MEETLNDLIARDLIVTDEMVDNSVLNAQPNLVKTRLVSPPRGKGRVRMVRIGQGETLVDLQACGGTHVARTGEIGRIRLGKIENKGRQNRRFNLHLED